MKVKELIEDLQKLNPELEVYIGSDDEGNSFRLLGFHPSEAYMRPYPGQLYYADMYADEDVENMDEDDKKELKRAVVI